MSANCGRTVTVRPHRSRQTPQRMLTFHLPAELGVTGPRGSEDLLSN